VALAETFSEKFPYKSVIIPFVVPFSNTLAPIIGSPLVSVTFPLTSFVCARRDKEQKKMHSSDKMCFDPAFPTFKRILFISIRID